MRAKTDPGRRQRKAPRTIRTRRFGAQEKDILERLSAGDLLYGYLLSAGSAGRMFKYAREHATYRYHRKKALERLKRDNFIVQRGEKLSLAHAGNAVLDRLTRQTKALLDASAWDGKWRVVIFDIPEKYAPLRRRVRDILKAAGFVQLQQSVWVFPHECEALAQLIKRESHLSQFILYGVLEKIGDDSKLRKLFKLPS